MGQPSRQPTEDELPNQLSNVDQHHDDQVAQEIKNKNNLWRSNYHEASIYIEEGLNNDKFENHPRKRAQKMASAGNQFSSGRGGGTTLLSCIRQQPSSPSDQQQQQQQQAHQHYIDGTPSVYNTTTGATTTTNGLNNNLLGGAGEYTTIETYILVHNRYFYQLDLVASVALLLLALVEPPAVDGYELNPTIHTAIELFALGIIAIELLLKFRWMGPRRFFQHGRTVTKLLILVTMNIETIVIFFRNSIHARYSRALRPIFLIDNHYCHGLRRAVRQIFQSLPPIIDMFTLVMFFMFVFSIFGFYLFAANNHYFANLSATIGNLLVLATTANLPDVMMPSYGVSRWSAVFFVLFVVIHLFLFTNLTMAAVYEVFTRKEKEKFHKLLLHRRKACQEAFKLLVSRRRPNRIQYRQFMGLMRYLNRKCSMFDAYLIFKALDTDKNGSISLEEFYQIYDFINLEWKLIYPDFKWYDEIDWLPAWVRSALALAERVLRHRLFEWTVDTLIAAQAFLQFIEASAFQLPVGLGGGAGGQPNQTTIAAAGAAPTAQPPPPPPLDSDDIRPDSVSTYIFISIFVAEISLRCLVFGPTDYWRNRWNRFDLIVLLISLAGLINGSLGGLPFGWVIVLRILRLMRLFEYKRRYRDMWQTLTYILLKRFVSMTCVVMILYYFFAIVGMELLGNYDLRNCCKNTSIESQFKFDNTTAEGAKYYLNDFGDLVASYLTLFSMSSNTYWLTTMSAYAIVSGDDWIRLFFGLYYLCSIIVMNIVIAFILESFLFHIHYRNKIGDNDDANLFTQTVNLSSTEVEFLLENLNCPSDTRELERTVRRVAKLRGDGQPAGRAFDNTNYAGNQTSRDDETLSLLGPALGKRKAATGRTRQPSTTSNADQQDTPRAAEPAAGGDRRSRKRSEGPVERSGSSSVGSRRSTWYLIYQAEQIRNKFSFTMKMYADEVGSWLAEAEQAEQDEMSLMISRNQIRAEHVAMARLARRNLEEVALDEGQMFATRPRSWSTSGGLRNRGEPPEKPPAKQSDLVQQHPPASGDKS